jgi:hypothetical protein
MAPLSIRVTLLAGIAAIAMTVPATASLAIWGSTNARLAQASATQQYAQGSVPRDRAAGIPGLNYKSKKSKSAKSKKTDTSGQAKSGDTK